MSTNVEPEKLTGKDCLRMAQEILDSRGLPPYSPVARVGETEVEKKAAIAEARLVEDFVRDWLKTGNLFVNGARIEGTPQMSTAASLSELKE